MTISNDYIPVIVPNDIDNEMEYIDPKDTALEIAVKMQADKLIYLSRYPDLQMRLVVMYIRALHLRKWKN